MGVFSWILYKEGFVFIFESVLTSVEVFDFAWKYFVNIFLFFGKKKYEFERKITVFYGIAVLNNV